MTPLVLVHGFLGGSAQWDGQVAAFSHARKVIALGLPGFGSQADRVPPKSIAGFADWVLAELDRRGVDRFHLLGHSMGGMIVQEVARRQQDSIASLILYATGAIGVLPGRFETIAQSKDRADADGARATARRIAATWFLSGQAAPGYQPCAAIAEMAALQAIHAGLDAMEGWSGDAHLPHIEPDTLVLWGDGDRTYPWPQIERLWQTIPSARLAVVPGCAHAVHLEKPDFFNKVLEDWLADRD